MKYRRPQRSMAATIAKRVVDGRYAFSSPELDCPVSKTTVCLNGKTFGKGADPVTFDVAGVASRKCKAPWFSPKADDVGINGADVRLLADARASRDPQVAEHAFMSCVSSYKYNLVIRRGEGRDPPLSWTYRRWHYADSCAFGWPVIIAEAPSHPDLKFLTLCRRVNEPLPITISTWTSVTVARVTWRGSRAKRSIALVLGGIQALEASCPRPRSPCLLLRVELLSGI